MLAMVVAVFLLPITAAAALCYSLFVLIQGQHLSESLTLLHFHFGD